MTTTKSTVEIETAHLTNDDNIGDFDFHDNFFLGRYFLHSENAIVGCCSKLHVWFSICINITRYACVSKVES